MVHTFNPYPPPYTHTLSYPALFYLPDYVDCGGPNCPDCAAVLAEPYVLLDKYWYRAPRCGQVTGYSNLLTKAACQAAAKDLGLATGDIDEMIDNKNYPAFCFVKGKQVVFNSRKSAVKSVAGTKSGKLSLQGE